MSRCVQETMCVYVMLFENYYALRRKNYEHSNAIYTQVTLSIHLNAPEGWEVGGGGAVAFDNFE
jgi:hypothetical protein